jgi:hypothetical protein
MKQRSLDTFRPKRTHKGWYRLRRPQNGPESTDQGTAAQVQSLAQTKQAAGIIRPDTGDLHVPLDLVGRGDGKQTNALPRVMLVIITLASIFIAIIAYLVSQMPPKT